MTPAQIRLLVVSAVAAFLVLLSFSGYRHRIKPIDITGYVGDLFAGSKESLLPDNTESLAYMTFLTGTMANVSDPDPDHDRYFVATRILGYQLMHQTETRIKLDIPFVVLVTDDVPPYKRERLTKDGATVIMVDYIRPTSDWIKGEMPEWRDVMTKLRAWELTQYSRVLFLDGDMLLINCLDEIFNESSAEFVAIEHHVISASDEAPLQHDYVMASMPEVNPLHAYPPTIGNNDFKDAEYFNAGFFIFAPSKEVFNHYKSLMELEDRFDPRYPEQNLLNYAHRRDGRAPWKSLDTSWNIGFPYMGDVQGGVASVHDKWWHAHMDERLQPFYTSIRWRMEGFYEARDIGTSS